ncbi:MAG: FecR domain-containing protein [Methylococcaceae bacterium]
MLKLNLLVLSMVSCLGVLPASAQDDVIGFVKTVQGEATVLTAKTIVKAQPGTPLYLGSVLKTGEEGSLGVTFKDNTVMSFGPDTEVTVDEYHYAPAKGDLKLVTSIAKGTLHYISGVIAKLKPEAVTVKTPTAIIGVRGTHFLVKAEAE